MSQATGFAVELDLGNAEMRTAQNVADALRKVAEQVENGATSFSVRDVNGNTVGDVHLIGGSYLAEFDEERRHLDELAAIGYEPDTLEPLREVEERAHKAAEDYCNVEGFDYERAKRDVEADVEELFGGDLPEGFFVNGDPRGYALKLKGGTGSLSHRDWGGFEILAPDFS